ncbi:MAG: DUF1937 family protein [Candidatus Omnitrophota bacterium]|jgi:nucleoside 2-deoxyribosyltransferase
MKRLYLAGPYSADNVIDVLANIRRGIRAAAYLISKGYAVFCPFLDFQIALTTYGEELEKEDYQRNSMAWVEVCDVVVVLPGSEKSHGVKREIERAVTLGIPVDRYEEFV